MKPADIERAQELIEWRKYYITATWNALVRVDYYCVPGLDPNPHITSEPETIEDNQLLAAIDAYRERQLALVDEELAEPGVDVERVRTEEEPPEPEPDAYDEPDEDDEGGWSASWMRGRAD